MATIWAGIDSGFTANVIQSSDINYGQIVSRGAQESAGDLNVWLQSVLPDIWMDAYDDMTGSSNEILQFSDSRYQYLFDYDLERVVAAFGASQPSTEKRDTSRQAGFIPRFSHHYEGKDRGHFMSHRQGGGMDVNFFPQKREVNRGWNDAGKIFRKMERFCAATAGVFCFVRPIYGTGDKSWDPEKIEYGLINDQHQFRVAVFPNR